MAHSSLLYKAWRRGWTGGIHLGLLVMLFPGEMSTSNSLAALASRRENWPQVGGRVCPRGGVKWASMVEGGKILLSVWELG